MAAGRSRNPFDGDTTWVAYKTYRDGHEGVLLVHPDGSGDHQVELGLPVTAQLPDWSPDGHTLAVTFPGRRPPRRPGAGLTSNPGCDREYYPAGRPAAST